MTIELYLSAVFYLNLAMSILNNCFVLVGLGFTIRKLAKVAKKRRLIRHLGEQYGYETCQWKYIEKQLRLTLLLLLLVIELLYLLLYNGETILSVNNDHISEAPVQKYSNDCVLVNGTFLAHEYDFTIPVIAFRLMRSLQNGLFVYGLWISLIFLSHISKAMNKLVERKKLVIYSVLGGIAPVVVVTVSCIPIMSIFKVLLTVVVSQAILTAATLQGVKFLSLVKKANTALQYGYRNNSCFMEYRRWLFKQYIIVTIALVLLFQIYIFRDMTFSGYTVVETFAMNHCWIVSTFKVQFSAPESYSARTYVLTKSASSWLNVIFHAGLFTVQIYVIACYYYKIQKKKPKQRQSMKDAYLSNSLLTESNNEEAGNEYEYSYYDPNCN